MALETTERGQRIGKDSNKNKVAIKHRKHGWWICNWSRNSSVISSPGDAHKLAAPSHPKNRPPKPGRTEAEKAAKREERKREKEIEKQREKEEKKRAKKAEKQAAKDAAKAEKKAGKQAERKLARSSARTQQLE